MATNHCRTVAGVVIGAGGHNKEMVIVTLVISEKRFDFLSSNIDFAGHQITKRNGLDLNNC